MARRFRRSTLAFSAAALVLAAVAALVFATAREVSADNAWAAHSSDIVERVEELALLERRAIASQRGYLLIAQPSLRDEFWQARAQLPLRVAELRKLVSDPEAGAQLEQLDQALAKRLEIAADVLAEYDHAGLESARTRIIANGSYALDQNIHGRIEALRSRELALLAKRRAASDDSANRLLLASSLGIPFSLGLLALVYRILIRDNAERRRSERAAQKAADAFEQISRRTDALSRYTGMLQSCTEPAEVLAVSARMIGAMAPALAGTIYLNRASRDHAEIAGEWGVHAAPTVAMPVPNECWAMRRNVPYHCADAAAQVSCGHVISAEAAPGTATACLPLSAHGEALGWMYLSGPAPLADLPEVSQAAEQLSLALANIRLKDDLLHQSIRDPLTGLFNRRYLEESLAREISRCHRRSLPLAVAILDVDHFKAFNDHHGHPGGDALLSSLGRLLQAACRADDIACRFGGEEFVMVLPETDGDTAMARMETLREDIARMNVMHLGSTLGRVTASLGVAMFPIDGGNGSALLGAADAALYAAKAAGRNRVVRAGTRNAAAPVPATSSSVSDSK